MHLLFNSQIYPLFKVTVVRVIFMANGVSIAWAQLCWLSGTRLDAFHPFSPPSSFHLLEHCHLLGHLTCQQWDCQRQGRMEPSYLELCWAGSKYCKWDYLAFPVNKGFPTRCEADASVIKIFFKLTHFLLFWQTLDRYTTWDDFLNLFPFLPSSLLLSFLPAFLLCSCFLK